MQNHEFDIIVIGGGHAGAEAAWAGANLHAAVALVTMDPSRTGVMSCNPAIGGLAKGQMVREIDALGGLMGRAIDATGIQFRMLNTSKGAAVHGPRAQADKYRYAGEVQRLLSTRPNIEVIRATVDQLLVGSDGLCRGVLIAGHAVTARAVVLTTGTFMRSLMHTGETKTVGGRIGEGSAIGISQELRRLEFELGRLKTGTPPRLAAESIDFAQLEPQLGDLTPRPFSEMSPDSLPSGRFPALPQICCHATQTNAVIHEIIRANIHRAPMYSGQIEAECGPRYCPSIEDKVVRFADRDEHHIFLEPESLTTNEIYCNGISTSLPRDVQEQIIPLVPGCARARILKYGYAVEYDMVWPHQIDATCMTKQVPGLFLAGQINGTSGYEEAAGQGVVAGLNAVRFARGEAPIRLGRETSYIGVMMDDLVTKTPREPYRMFTSRAEFRLLLRADNAPERLTPMGRDLGLVCDDRWRLFEERREKTRRFDAWLDERATEGLLQTGAGEPRTWRETVRSRIHDADDLLESGAELVADRTTVERTVNDILYEGYIARQQADLKRLKELERRSIPDSFRYNQVTGLGTEARDALNRFKPRTLGQAGRLAGVNPVDVTLLAVAIKAWRMKSGVEG